MRIGIDARFFGPVGKGLGRYTQKLIENLEKIDERNQYFVFLKSDNFNDYQPKNKKFKKVLADYRWYTFAEQIKFPVLLRKYKLDLVHFPHFNVPIFYLRKFIVTIHDLILINFPTTRSSTLNYFFYHLKYLAYKLVIKSAIFRSNRIIAVSKFTRSDILQNYSRIPKEKIFVTYEACEDFCMVNPKKEEEILARYGIIKPYILYVGNVYPHKNPERLILAFNLLEKRIKKLKLVFVGSEDYFYKRLKRFVKKNKIKNVIFTGYLSDHDLDVVFRKSISYIRPSLYEGFELPPLEAMAKGVPVLSSNHSCALEILGDSVLYFDGENTAAIAGAIEKIFRDIPLRERLIRKGYERILLYNWKKMAKITLALYESIKK